MPPCKRTIPSSLEYVGGEDHKLIIDEPAAGFVICMISGGKRSSAATAFTDCEPVSNTIETSNVLST